MTIRQKINDDSKTTQKAKMEVIIWHHKSHPLLHPWILPHPKDDKENRDKDGAEAEVKIKHEMQAQP